VIYRKSKLIKARSNVTNRLNTLVQRSGTGSQVLHPDMK